MGRKNGKLTLHLRKGLEQELYKNLKYEDSEKVIFTLILPRFNRNEDMKDFEKILIDWYDLTGNISKYKTYSIAKAVFQAALKKSIYLVSLSPDGKKLRFRFATLEEVEEKKKLRNEKSRDSLPDYLNLPSVSLDTSYSLSPNPPLSEGGSSGYHSGDEENIVTLNEQNDLEENIDMDFLNDLDLLNDIFSNPSKYVEDSANSTAFNLCDNILEDNKETGDNDIDILKPPDQLGLVEKPVTELTATPVDTSEFLKKTYWLCSQKLNVDQTLILICDKQVIQNDNSGIIEDQVVIPNSVWGCHVSYDLKKSFEFGGKFYCFFSPLSV